MTAASQRAGVRVMVERRRRIWRRLGLILVVTAVIVVLAQAQRDSDLLRRQGDHAKRGVAGALQEIRASIGKPPDVLRFAQRPDDRLSQYYFNPLYAEHAREDRPAGVACLRAPLSLFLRPAGRYVVLYDGATFRVEWMTESDFQQRADGLGLGPAKIAPET